MCIQILLPESNELRLSSSGADFNWISSNLGRGNKLARYVVNGEPEIFELHPEPFPSTVD